MTAKLPRLVAAVLRRVVPQRHVAALVAELADDYARIRGRSRAGAAVWLCRETASLGWTFARAAIGGDAVHGPLWTRDARLVLRGMRRAPVATVSAAMTLSVGVLAICLTAGIAGTLLFRSVSATHGNALRRIAAVDAAGRSSVRLSFIELELVRDHLAGAALVAAANLQPVVLRVAGADTQTMVEVVDGRYFDLVGAQTVLGRGLMSSDDRAAAAPVTVVSEALWRRRFGRDPAMLGRTVQVNGAPFTVVGVIAASASASALGAGVDAWTPLAHADAVLNPGWRANPEARWFVGLALPLASPGEVETRLGAAAVELARRQPEAWRDRTLRTLPGSVLVGGQRANVTMLVWILTGLSVLILAAGAASVGGVLTARAAAAQVHTAIHLSMGAGRAAVARRLLFEGAILGGLGGAIAAGLYLWARRQFAEIALLPTLSLRLELPLTVTGVAGMWVVAVVVGGLLAVGPAVWAAHANPMAALAGGRSRSVVGAASRTRRILVATQLAVSLALVVGAVLFARSLAALVGQDVGFPRAGLVAMDFDLEPTGPAMRDPAALARDALRRAAALPAVTGAAMANRAPVDPSTPAVDVRRGRAEAIVADVSLNLVTEGYFTTVGLPLAAGRAFTEDECNGGTAVVIVNESLARHLWPDGDAVGRALVVGRDEHLVRVVGVATDSKYRSIAEAGRLHVYRPTAPSFGFTLLARTAGDPRDALRAMQAVLDGVGPGVIGFFPRTLDDHLAIELLPTRVAAAVASLLGSLALLLSAVGLYGLVAWLVEQQRREIGVRMAIGARRVDVVRLVVAQALSAAVPGLLGGVGLAAALAAAVRAGLHGVAPLDPVAFSAAVVALLATVGIASWVPSWRAARVDPAVALRDS